MKIGVISDTHLSKPSAELFDLMEGVFADVSLVLHAGDLTKMSVLEAFSDKELIAVRGNMDDYDTAAKLPIKEIVKVDGYRIGLIHGWGTPKGIEDRILSEFDDVHAVVYGHTHRSANHIKNGILFFNPGAFSGTFLLGHNRSIGILTIGDGIIGTVVNLP